MPTNVNDIIKKLSPAQRKKVEARGAQLIAEEMTLRETAACTQTYPGPCCKDSRNHPGQRLASRKAQRSVALDAAEDREGHGRQSLSGG